MSAPSSLNQFFKRIERSYDQALGSINKILEHKELIHTSHLEIEFVLILIAKLRLDFQKNSIFTKDVLEEMLKGGHLKFQDNGTLYNELAVEFNSNLQKRFSSHNSIGQQYSLSGPVIKEILFGVSEDKEGNRTTWIQFERHHTKTIVELILHLVDYVMHKWTGKNIGPFGASNHTEQNPIIVEQAQIQDDTDPNATLTF